ncbi:tRNA pseudouridine(38-40) synthase TruA [Candidatus Methylomirabilis sp.]|uniref:tRNA pseudouridine(38-40) synthase TruA n=1 Tax=Candidatus Methylomirabilis sp. TaxID=2032687 RepID=UPI002A692FE2|nr:tRNA pseudouridine(38-40) synthase TruA [Candidatus Methylomirabilis sp.]
MTIEYDGTDYHGWQVQPGMTTIQGTLEEAVARIVGQRIHVMGAGRTDAGVHAFGQVASLRAPFSHPPDTLRRALTSVLPSDIVVSRVEEVDEDFHAQRCARWKRYRYTLLTRPYPSAIERRYTLFVPHPIKIDAMAEAARTLIGTHDFSAFQAAHSSAESSVRTVLVAEFRQEGDHLAFDIVADGFLRHMIRIIMGTLLDVGRGRLRPEDLKVILEGKDRSHASKTISPHALCMLEVGYQPFQMHPEQEVCFL